MKKGTKGRRRFRRQVDIAYINMAGGGRGDVGRVFVKEQRTSLQCMSLRACAKFASIACASEALLIIVALSTWSLNNLASSP